MRTAAAPVGASGDIDTARGDHHRTTERIAAQQTGEGPYPRHQGIVVIAGGAQDVEIVGFQRDDESLLQRTRRAACLFMQEVDQIF